jgi:hypothetical protein
VCQHKNRDLALNPYREVLYDGVQVIVAEGVLWPWRLSLWVLGVLGCIFLTLVSEAAWAGFL